MFLIVYLIANIIKKILKELIKTIKFNITFRYFFFVFLFFRVGDRKDFFNFRYLQFRHKRLRSRLDKTHAKSSIYLRQNALARLEGNPQAILPPTFGRWDGSSSRAFTRRIVCKSLAA